MPAEYRIASRKLSARCRLPAALRPALIPYYPPHLRRERVDWNYKRSKLLRLTAIKKMISSSVQFILSYAKTII
ncbi:hypothetical protein AP518_02407 [Actinobacillus pleuropneumoniae]|nr:hypothetical protein AP1022_02301 [Actinobacillus pleuropneumoniae]KIE87967.1 hypothetical protein AP518_02407 [Actinobacillus pleuropneumoniae]